ncbi:hypothetical protein [Fluviicola sp.]|uniref:hypothetical protein n=1 Tax=Fluviicola sp. TaxID=1917219 RepID=UPI0031D92C46
MNLLLRKGSLALFAVQMSFWSFGQTVSQQLNPEEIANRIAYVHGSDFVTNNPTLVTALGKVMTDRIEYQLAPPDENEKYPLLSSMPLLTKMNPGVHGADFQNFDLNTFNPLVYNLEFFSDKTQVFRIDNTNYIMIVKPIQRY